MSAFLGVDIGGNHVKLGFLSHECNAIIYTQSHSTSMLRAGNGFIENLGSLLRNYCDEHPEVERIGIGLPGTLDKTRTIALEVPAIPELNGTMIHQLLTKQLPSKKIYLENDANAAALGEYLFGADTLPDSFVMITLGTGVGSAAIIDQKIFLGGDGNAFELGDIPSRNGCTLEQNIGKEGIIELLESRFGTWTGSSLMQADQLTPEAAEAAASKGDPFAKQVFEEVGEILGEALLALIRIVDIKTIVLGGGISEAFDHIVPACMCCLDERLTPYFKEGLEIRKATLGNIAGVAGAASLCNE